MLLPRVVSFRCKSESLQQQRKFALRAGIFRARTGRNVNYCDRCADFEPLGVERRRLQPEQCHLHCRLRGEHRVEQDGRGVSLAAPRVFSLDGQTKAPCVVSDREQARWLLG